MTIGLATRYNSLPRLRGLRLIMYSKCAFEAFGSIRIQLC